MDSASDGHHGVTADVAAYARLDEDLGDLGQTLAGLHQQLDGLLGEIRIATGVDELAEAFRPRLNEAGSSAKMAIDAVGRAFDNHRDAIRRGVAGLAAGDVEASNAVERRL